MGIATVSRGDPRVAAFGAVRDGELLRSRGLFVAEGRQVVRRVIEDAPLPRAVRAPQRRGDGAISNRRWPALAAGRADLCLRGARQLADIAGYDVHRGCLALVHRPPPTPVDALAVVVDDCWWCSRACRMPTTSAGCFATRRRSARTACCSARPAAIRCTARRSERRWARRCAYRLPAPARTTGRVR